MPTHRLFRGVPEMTSGELAAKLGDCFTCRVAGEGPELAPHVWEDIETGGNQGTIGLFTRKDNRWTIATLTAAGQARMAEVAKEHNEEWRQLGVALSASADHRRPAGLHRSAQADLRASGRRSRRRTENRRISAGRVGHAGHGRSRPPGQPPRRTHAGKEHVFLSEAAQRAGDQSAGIAGWI